MLLCRMIFLKTAWQPLVFPMPMGTPAPLSLHLYKAASAYTVWGTGPKNGTEKSQAGDKVPGPPLSTVENNTSSPSL